MKRDHTLLQAVEVSYSQHIGPDPPRQFQGKAVAAPSSNQHSS